MGQKLLPKDCLAAAAAAQRNTRSAENLSLKHQPAGPGRPNQYQKIKKARLFQGKYMPFFSSRALRAQNRLISKKLVFLDRFLWPSHFFRRRVGLQNPAFCLCFLSLSKHFKKQNLQKKVVYLNCGPARAANQLPAPPEGAKQGNPHKLCTSKFHGPKRGVLTLFVGRSASMEPLFAENRGLGRILAEVHRKKLARV